MPFAKLNNFNHTDPTNHRTEWADMTKLNNEFWDRKKGDRIVSRCPTKRKDLKPTENTKYGRSELRQVDPKTGQNTAIKIDQFKGCFVAVRQAIQDLGPAGKSIGLQWHGSSTRPLAKAQLKNGKQPDTFDINLQLADVFEGDDGEPGVLVTGIKRHEIYDLALGFSKDTFIFAYNWNQPNAVVKTYSINKDGSYKKDKGLYGKLGIYCQTDIKLAFEKMQDGCGEIIHVEFDVYMGDKFDLSVIDLDKSSFWKVGEMISDDSPERFQAPAPKPVEEPAKPAEPAKPTEPEKPAEPVKQPSTPAPEPEKNPAPTPQPEPTKQPLPDPAKAEELYKGVPQEYLPNIQRLVGQIQVNVTNGAKVTAKANLTKLEDIVDELDDAVSGPLRNWCNIKRDSVK